MSLRWLALLQASDLMLDVLFGFLALYLVDVAHASPVEAALGVAMWTGAGLVGGALLLVVLRHIAGVRYLRWSALLAAAVYAAFLVVPSMTVKLVALAALGLLNSGWYAIPQAQLYETVAPEPEGCRRTTLVGSVDLWSSSSTARASSARKVSPSTTCCCSRRSRPSFRTTSRPGRG